MESYTVILRGGAVVIVALAQLLGQSLQSVLLVQPGHTFLNERHHTEGGKRGQYYSPSLKIFFFFFW